MLLKLIQINLIIDQDSLPFVINLFSLLIKLTSKLLVDFKEWTFGFAADFALLVQVCGQCALKVFNIDR